MIVTATVNGTDIHLDVDTMDADADDSLTGTTSKGVRNYERWRYETYTTKEPDTLEWIDTFLQSGEVLYDIGANIGLLSLLAAHLVSRMRSQHQIRLGSFRVVDVYIGHRPGRSGTLIHVG